MSQRVTRQKTAPTRHSVELQTHKCIHNLQLNADSSKYTYKSTVFQFAHEHWQRRHRPTGQAAHSTRRQRKVRYFIRHWWFLLIV